MAPTLEHETMLYKGFEWQEKYILIPLVKMDFLRESRFQSKDIERSMGEIVEIIVACNAPPEIPFVVIDEAMYFYSPVYPDGTTLDANRVLSEIHGMAKREYFTPQAVGVITKEDEDTWRMQPRGYDGFDDTFLNISSETSREYLHESVIPQMRGVFVMDETPVLS
jgi:hypothetical protein